MRSALFVVSIDLEMSWGSVHHGRPHDDAPYRQERQIVADVLEIMDRYGISATWAVVGHLFLGACEQIDGVAHPEIRRPEYSWLNGDWYDLDPTGSGADHPTWYGSDLVDLIRACRTPQEIGSHSFGHIIAGDPECSREAFSDDIAAAIDVANDQAVELRSFVYPRNSIGHLEVLADAGFRAYRGPTPSDTEHRRPTIEGRLVNVPHTYMFDPGSRNARRLGTWAWGQLLRNRLRSAVETSSMFHLWFHSHNLHGRRRRARSALDRLFAYARQEIDAGRLRNLTMAEVADEMLAEAGGRHR